MTTEQKREYIKNHLHLLSESQLEELYQFLLSIIDKENNQ